MKSFVGEFDLEVPRDRNGTFEPQLCKFSKIFTNTYVYNYVKILINDFTHSIVGSSIGAISVRFNARYSQ